MVVRDIVAKSNAQIKKEVYKAIGEDTEIDVDVYDGIVRLKGFVPSIEVAEFIESTIRELPGVDEVDNELAVRMVQ